MFFGYVSLVDIDPADYVCARINNVRILKWGLATSVASRGGVTE